MIKQAVKQHRAVFLDFDGVLFDTVKEAYIVCLFAIGKIRRVKDVNYESEDFKIFKKYRYLVGPAWNYFYLLKVIKEMGNAGLVELENRYLVYLAQADASNYKRFERKFFTSREYLKRNYEVLWLGLNTPYNFLPSISALIDKYPHNFFIVTTKDMDTVLKLLKINDQDFNPKNIYGRDNFEKCKTKGNLIRNIMKDRSVESAIFVDDNRVHLSDCDSVCGLKLLQSQWGYVSPGDNVSREDEILSEIKELLGEA